MNFAPKPIRTKAAHEWLEYLRDSEGLGGILAKTEDLAKLKIALKAALFELDLDNLAPKIEAGWRSSGRNELFLLVNGASIATRLQQILPSLINELSKKGVICTSIKVRLKPVPPTWEVKPQEGRQAGQKPTGFNAVARASWESLLEKLAPDSDLRKAVERLLQSKPK
ncbi:MAG: hypothetical protein B7Y05_02170 [Polynucleobacter sp. 24-46-87]|jgi:hypothetical protein|nr:MAG: hypothetical protein B7Y67_02570 [Polynucleobacter sp. 35-46-11]OZA15843.1 MAG: hypothetical protein B7Y05_02170 [Polynucleobacter sp. 24-46-87]OZA77584.1 MAG: hypothetical protein B7X71_04480 [Polynucleobacter sp. 39-46-10]